MFLRVFLLLSLIGQIGPSAADDTDGYKHHGKIMGNLLVIVVVLGFIVLASLVVIAILALGGHFDNTNMDPVT